MSHFHEAQRILSVTHLAEKLKDELRHQWTTSLRQESVAEHSWRLAWVLILCFPYIKHPIDFRRAITMAIIHDIVEAEAGDLYFLATDKKSVEEQPLKEEKAIEHIRSMLNSVSGDDIFSLWHEFNELSSYEAKLVRALDKIEGYIQQNEADISTWTEEETVSVFYYLDSFCDFDPFIQQLKELVISESLLKIKNSNLNIHDIAKKVKALLPLSPVIRDRLEQLYVKI